MRHIYEVGNRAVGSLTPVGMSSDVVLDISGAEPGDNVGSLTPVGMSSDVPAPVVALIIDNGTNSMNANAGKRKPNTITPDCEEFRLTTYCICD
jgi:hypothetical protein